MGFAHIQVPAKRGTDPGFSQDFGGVHPIKTVHYDEVHPEYNFVLYH